MKPHRPWQPHMGSSPLFNPYTPPGRNTTLDHYDLTEEEQEDQNETDEAPPEEPGDTLPEMKRD
jgi:hypothetical protein